MVRNLYGTKGKFGMKININGYIILIDDRDSWIVDYYSLWVSKYKKYVYCEKTINYKRISKRLHRLIMKVNDPKILIDHINKNTLDNRRCNLRLATNSQNLANSKINKNNTSGYKGVAKSAYPNKPWRVRVGKKSYGYYFTKEEAAKAYNYYAQLIYGEFASLNEI